VAELGERIWGSSEPDLQLERSKLLDGAASWFSRAGDAAVEGSGQRGAG